MILNKAITSTFCLYSLKKRIKHIKLSANLPACNYCILNKSLLDIVSSLFTPEFQYVKIYDNIAESRGTIAKDLKDKTIIYMLYNKTTQEIYIGSALNGNRRMNSYFYPSVLKNTTHSKIYNSITRYGHANFSLIVLEDCDLSGLDCYKLKKIYYLQRETYYITCAVNNYKDKLLNILVKGGSSLGYKHTANSILKMSTSKTGTLNHMFNKKHLEETKKSISASLKNRKGHKISEQTKLKISRAHIGKSLLEETKQKISAANKNKIVSPETRRKLQIAFTGRTLSPITRHLMSISRSKPIIITNTINNAVHIYNSIKQAALEFNTTPTKIARHIKNKTVMYDIYVINWKPLNKIPWLNG